MKIPIHAGSLIILIFLLTSCMHIREHTSIKEDIKYNSNGIIKTSLSGALSADQQSWDRSDIRGFRLYILFDKSIVVNETNFPVFSKAVYQYTAINGEKSQQYFDLEIEEIKQTAGTPDKIDFSIMVLPSNHLDKNNPNNQNRPIAGCYNFIFDFTYNGKPYHEEYNLVIDYTHKVGFGIWLGFP